MHFARETHITGHLLDALVQLQDQDISLRWWQSYNQQGITQSDTQKTVCFARGTHIVGHLLDALVQLPDGLTGHILPQWDGLHLLSDVLSQQGCGLKTNSIRCSHTHTQIHTLYPIKLKLDIIALCTHIFIQSLIIKNKMCRELVSAVSSVVR